MTALPGLRWPTPPPSARHRAPATVAEQVRRVTAHLHGWHPAERLLTALMVGGLLAVLLGAALGVI